MQEQEKQQQSNEFQPDPAIKKFLTELSTERFIGIINELCGTNYPLDSIVDFGNTEHFSVLGDLDKSSVRGDLTATIHGGKPHGGIPHEGVPLETTNKIIVELQSTKDKRMGFRMFVYSLNEAEESEDGNTYIFPKGVTIYTTLDLPQKGKDEVHMQIEHFRVGETSYSAKDGDVLTVEFPYVNLLTMDYEQFNGSSLEPLKVIYPYRYRKNPKLLKNREELQRVMENVREFAITQKGNDRFVVNGIVYKIIVDIMEVCRNNPTSFKEEQKIMNAVYMSSADIFIEESEKRAEKRGKEEGIREGIYAMIRVLLEFQVDEDGILDKVVEEFSLGIEEARRYYQMYLEQKK